MLMKGQGKQMEDAGRKRSLVFVNYQVPGTLLRASFTWPNLFK
jgi:hypothetical protein